MMMMIRRWRSIEDKSGPVMDAVVSAAVSAAETASLTHGRVVSGGSVSAAGGEVAAERRERVLLRPWLENLIHSGVIPGLEWIDADKTMFKVPWKHRSKKNWSLRHSSVFLVGCFTQ